MKRAWTAHGLRGISTPVELVDDGGHGDYQDAGLYKG